MGVNLHFETTTSEGIGKLARESLYKLWCKQNGQEFKGIIYTRGEIDYEKEQGA